MDHHFRAHAFRVTSIALIVALTGCATQTPEPVITEATRNKLVQALQDSGDTENAAILRGQSNEQKPAPAPDPLMHASALIAAGQVDQGIGDAKAVLAARGDDTATALEVGRMAVRSNHLTDAAEVYRQLLSRHPESVEALNGTGVILAQQGDLGGASDAFRKALAQRPQDIPSLNNLALVMILQGNPTAALSLLKSADHPDQSPQIKNILAVARERSGVSDAPQPAPLAQVKSHPLPPPEATPVAMATHVPASPPAAPIVAASTVAAPAAVVAAAVADTPNRAPQSGSRRIVLRARADAWLQVRDPSGHVLLERNMHPGESWTVPPQSGLAFTTGNAGGTELLVDGVVAAPLGGSGVIARDIPLDPDMIKSGKLPEQMKAARLFASLGPT